MVNRVRTIIKKGSQGIINNYSAVGAINPGDLVTTDADGKVSRRLAASGVRPMIVATENESNGHAVYDVNNDVRVYSINDIVNCIIPVSGYELFLSVGASRPVITKGDSVTIHATDGGVTKAGISDTVIGVALETLDNSANPKKSHILVQVV